MAMILRAPRQPHPSQTPCRHCGRRHRNWNTLAACRWRRACWISGNGRYASVSLCGRDTTVMLFEERGDAWSAKRTIDATGCGGRCRGHHFVVDLAEVALEEWR